MNPLSELGNLPLTPAVLTTLYPRLTAIGKKVARLEREGTLVRLKRGLYVVSPRVSGCPLSTGLLSNDIYAPSYVSQLTALRYYGLIPETVVTIQAMTTKHSRLFTNAVGRFAYTRTTPEAFAIGLTQQLEAGTRFIIATPEKALCDLIATTPGLNLRYPGEALRYLRDDLRLDTDYLPRLDTRILRQYIAVGKKARSIRTLLQLLR